MRASHPSSPSTQACMGGGNGGMPAGASARSSSTASRCPSAACACSSLPSSASPSATAAWRSHSA
eukprot:3167584-Prymnesium_polylepis.1